MMSRFQPDPVSPQVRAEQIRLIYEQGKSIQLLGIATGIVAVTVLWPVASHALLLLWFGIHLALTLGRLRLNVAFAARKPDDERELKKWAGWFVAGTFLASLVWAGLCLFYDATWPAPDQVILFVIYTGLIGGAFNTYAPYFVAFLVFYLPPAIAVVSTLLVQGEEPFYALAALFVIYTALMYASALKLCNRYAQSLANRFENERLANELALSNQQLTSLAGTDELTGLDNRRSMFNCLSREWNRLYRSQQPLSLMYIDIDYFKQYNDTYGHEGGDLCLIRVAQLLRGHALRSSDMASRFGGEEFSLILPETSAENANTVAAAILRDLDDLNIAHVGSRVADRLTVSIGIATMIPDRLEGDAELRKAADRALYKAKQSGRNRVVVAAPTEVPRTGT